jgi:hypothetical protein
MNDRMVVVGSWRAYLLGAVLLAIILLVLFTAGLLAVGLLAVGAVLYLGHRALRAIGLARPTRSVGEEPGVIEGEYRVVERRLPDE